MMETLVWASRYIRLMYWPRWNSPRTVVGGPGFGGKSAWRSPTSNSLRRRCAGFHGVQVPPSWSTTAGFPPPTGLGLTKCGARTERRRMSCGGAEAGRDKDRSCHDTIGAVHEYVK